MICNLALIDLLNIIRDQDTCVANKILAEFDDGYDGTCLVRTCYDCLLCERYKNEHIDELIQHIEREEILSDE